MPYRCDGGGGQPIWRISGAVGAVRTNLVFDGDRVRAEQLTVAATVGRFATPRLGLSLTLGGLVAGSIDDRRLGPGGSGSLGITWLARRERSHRRTPFVLVTGSFAGVVAGSTTDDGDATYVALDARVGIAVGKTFFQKLTLYGGARVFGGPVWWRRLGAGVIGSDAYHVTVGAGVTYRIPGVLDLGVEAMPLGEQSAVASVTVHL
ncbi:MAG: hypothetical protein H6709_11525 [Kofleriaceae bacterium]|nr:hypothetical protein [Myxococcales bacterium]MCB9562918.1 hypothetical protein [Kofleriaceae bacterium]MCB9572705.1 hypothetical protein [Kofleriaceae bacterium]